MTNFAHNLIEMPVRAASGASPEPHTADHRAEHRFSVSQRVSVTLIGGPECRLSAVVRNVSRKGMSLELDCVLNTGNAVKVEWDDRVLLGNIKHLHQRGGSTILGVELFSTWESFLEEILSRHAQEVEKSHQDLQSLTCLASHEMQETLAVAMLYVNLLAKGAEAKQDAESLRLARRAQSAASRMRELTHDLATYTRVITDPLRIAPVDCERLVNGLKAIPSDCEGTVTHDHLPTVMADGRGLLTVFQNLISNGLKFNRHESKHVHVSARHKGPDWIFSVSDNGIGIDPQAQDRLFEPFARLHDPSEYSGCGLGLALTRRIVENHAGRIWMEPNTSGGSVFSFSIPARPKPWE